jgi:acyl carrier protein
MTEADFDRLQAVFRAVFQLPEASDVRQLSQADCRRWDSLAHVLLVSALESEFRVTFDPADLLSMGSYWDSQALLEKKLLSTR